MNVLFVCTGNTCRSPMAEGYLASKQLSGVTAASRGLFADGSPVSENAVLVMREAGIDLSAQFSRQITAEDAVWADKILCLSPGHRQMLEEAGVSTDKLFLLGNGISDPFGGDLAVYRDCRDQIFASIDRLTEEGFFASFTVCEIESRHLPALGKLEKICFSEPWSQQAFVESYKHGTCFFVAERDEKVLGYIGIQSVLDEGYITNIAVFPTVRRQGVGTALLKRTFSFANEKELAFLSLEVRVSNTEAIALYKKNGFRTEGRRKDFYRAPKEDALIMTKRFSN